MNDPVEQEHAIPTLVAAMREKLRRPKNAVKAAPPSVRYCLFRASEEVGEMADAVRRRLPAREVWRKAADVANTAMMAAALYEREGGER